MAYIQKNSPPPNKILSFSLKNFAGGINNRSDLLQPNEAYRLLNMSFLEDELMVKRDGTGAYDEYTLNSPITFMDEYFPYTDAPKMVKATNSELFIDNVKIMDVAGGVCGVNFDGKYYFADGGKLYVYGRFPQVDSTYVTVTGTINTGYMVMQITDPASNYTPLDTTHTRGMMFYNYDTKTVCYEPCQLELEDTFKGANILPNKVKYVIVHHGRLFASGNNTDDDNVFISDVRNPYYFAVSLPMQLPPNSDKVRGMIVYDDAVVVGRGRDVYFIQGSTNNYTLGVPVFTLRRLNTHTGIANHHAMKVAHNNLFFLGDDGVAYSVSSVNQDVKVTATSILSKQLDLYKDPFHLVHSDMEKAVSYFFKDEWYVSINELVLVYSYRHRAWTMYKGLNARSFYHKDGELLWGNEAGIITHFTSEGLDYGIPFEAYWTSKMFDMDESNAYKQFREFYIVAHTFNEKNSDIRLTFEIDYVDVKNEVVIQNQISYWGKSRFGERFITRNTNASLPFVIGRRGRGIRFTFRNGYTPSAPVSTRLELDSYLGLQEGMLVMVQDENTYYVYRNGTWEALEESDLNQAMKIYQVNGEYEYRGKR